jgi:hypothetical protein
VLSALALVLPLGLAASVSPVLLTEQTVLVASPDGRRKGSAFAAGTVVVLLVVVVAVALLGRSVDLPREPRLGGRLDLVIGGAVLAIAVVVARWRPRSAGAQRPPRTSLGPVAAFGFGVFSMATNVTTLAIVLVAARDIAAAPWGVPVTLLSVLLLVALAAAPAWAPILVAALPNPRAQQALTAVSEFFDRRGRLLVVAVLGLVSAFLLVRGLLRLTGL